jgi:hypothetical protein
VVVVEPDLPEARVAAEDGGVASTGHEAIERVAHAPRPVLVVADRQVQLVAVEHLGVLLEVLGDRHVDAVPVRLGPADERPLPVPPPGAAAPDRDAPRLGPLEEPEALAVGLGLHLATGRLGLGQEPPGERTVERDAGAAGVERRAAPIVVGLPCRGRQHEEDRRAVVVAGPHHDEGVGLLGAARQVHGVIAGAPLAAHGDLERGGPPTAVGRGVLGGGVVAGPDALGPPEDLAAGALARDADPEGRSVRGYMQRNGFAGRGGRGPAVRLEHRPELSGTAPRNRRRRSRCRRRAVR